MKSADEIKRLFHSAAVQTNAAPDDAVFETLKTAYTRTVEHKSAQREPRMWRYVMKSPLTKLAAAAVVVIACVIGLSVWRTTGSGIALADVLARVEQVKVVKFKWTFKFFGEDPNKPWADTRGTQLTSQEYGFKMIFKRTDPNGEERTGTELYVSRQKKPTIWIDRTEKTYIRMAKDAQAQDGRSPRQIVNVKDPLSSLKEILNTKYESMGRSTMDGIEVAGFRTTDPNYVSQGKQKEPSQGQVDVKIWVDVKTLFPVRIEGLGGGGGRTFMSTAYDFQWDVPVDASEFEPPPIPDGYAITDMFPERANEENAIQGLKQCVELLGNYPERIDLTYLWSESEKSETAAALRVKEELKGLTGLDRDQKKLDALKPTRFLNKFYVGLAGKFYVGMASKDPAYYGKTVTPKDTDTVLMRWKVSDNEYRVIFGDLHAETVSPQKLAELEKVLPK